MNTWKGCHFIRDINNGAIYEIAGNVHPPRYKQDNIGLFRCNDGCSSIDQDITSSVQICSATVFVTDCAGNQLQSFHLHAGMYMYLLQTCTLILLS